MPKNHYKIVLDLEFNPIRIPELREYARHEIIEIGAVKLNDGLEIVGEFDEYIKPQHNIIEPKITSITGITDEKLEGCGDFGTVMYKFMEWIGDEPFSLYSWSMSDRDVMLNEIDLKYPDDVNYDRFFVHWIDLQKIYQRMMGFSKSMGLTNALGTLKIYFDGTEHGALADAKNTAEVMRFITDREKMDNIKHSSGVTYNNTSSSGFTMGNLFATCIKKKPHS
ncbi:MAG: exonuclease domain-containing protein [Huintestinicola sp.]